MSSDSSIWQVPDEMDTGTVKRKRTPLGVQVAAAIRRRINSTGLPSGAPLPSEAKLAEEFGVSQRVIRDALRTLNNEGIVETGQGRHATVGDFHPVAVENYFKFAVDADGESIGELMDLRLALEPVAARLAARHATEEERTEMRRLLDELESTGTDLERRVPADLALHDLLARASHNRFIHGILSALDRTLTEERRRGAELVASTGRDHADSDTQHAALVLAVAGGDADAAEAHARAIVQRARTYFEQRAD